MVELIGMKDDKLKKRCRVFGEQMKPIVDAALKRQVEQHNDIGKMKTLVEALVGDMKNDYEIERVTEALAQQTGAAVGMTIRAIDALGECDGVSDGALKKLKEWARDIQNLGDPNLKFAPPTRTVIVPKKGIIQPKLRIVPKTK